jgi:hypothetical protein
MKTTFHPWNKYNAPTTNALAPLISVVDRSNNTALASSTAAISYGSSMVHDPSTKFSRVAKMTGVGEAQWIIMANSPATTDRFYFKLYGSGNANSINVYDYHTIIMLQVRGRQ